MKQVIVGGGRYDLLDTTDIEYNCLSGGYPWGVAPFVLACVSTAGTFRNLRVELDATPGGGTYTFSLWRAVGVAAGAVTALTCTVAADGTTASDTTHDVAVAAGDVICLECDPTTAPTARYARWSVEFEGDTANESLILSTGYVVNSATWFSAVGRKGFSDVEANVRTVCPTAGTIKDLYIQLSADPGTDPDAYKFTLRIANAGNSYVLTDTTLTCTITADGRVGNDTAHAITVAAGDLLTLDGEPLNTPATSNIDVAIGMTFVADTDGESVLWGGSKDDLSNAGTEYNALVPDVNRVWTATESEVYQLSNACTFKKFYVALSGSPGAGNTYTFTIRQEGGSPANGLVVVITGTATTGNDTTNTISISDGDTIDLMVVPDSTPTVRDAYWGLVCSVPIDYPISSSVLIGVLPAATRLAAMDRDSSVILGVVASATKGWGRAIASSVIVGVAVSATYLWNHIRASSVIIGVVATATRSIIITRASSVIVGVVSTATRVFPRTIVSSVIVGVSVSATRVMTATRVASVVIGNLVSASRVAAISRASTVIVGVVATATRVRAISKASSVIIGVVSTATRAIAVTRTSSVVIGVLASIIFTINRILRILGVLSTDLTIKSTLSTDLTITSTLEAH